MIYLAIIFHMHQPYYANLLTNEAMLPWVRMHGVKDYLDMAQLLRGFPRMRQTFNIAPSLVEQITGYVNGSLTDAYYAVSAKPVDTLHDDEKRFIRERFFSLNPEKGIQPHPRYYELYLTAQAQRKFSAQDYIDLIVWSNLAWIDPLFRAQMPELNRLIRKGRFFTEEDKQIVLASHRAILAGILPEYRKMREEGHLEISVSPFYHPILPLLYDSSCAREANPAAVMPKEPFAYPQDAAFHVAGAVAMYTGIFGEPPAGMWPSEEAVSNEIIPLIISSGIRWIVTDEAILFKSLQIKTRDRRLLYQPYRIERAQGTLDVIFRDRGLSDLIGFVYPQWEAEKAANDFLAQMSGINAEFPDNDVLVTIAMDGENAWEYYDNDGHDFLALLYERLSETPFIRATTPGEYLLTHQPPEARIGHLAAGSWIYGEFSKWIGNPPKNLAWTYLAKARRDFAERVDTLDAGARQLAHKQLYICEGSDWFWWYGEDPTGDFDRLFRMHLTNLYTIMELPVPAYLRKPIAPENLK